jgi:hypothetical protein
MAALNFATRAYPKFGTAKNPKPDTAWKSSVYYFWWEYLRRHAGYRACCEQGGSGEFSELYKDFGDVHAVEFKTWWQEKNRGGRLFAEPAADVLFGELDYENIKQLEQWNTDAVMVVRVPLTQSKRHLAKRFNTLLAKRHSGERGKRLQSRSLAKYPLASHFKIDSLKASLAAYDMRLADPKKALWRIAIEAGLADTMQRELKKQKFEPTADQCNALAVAASRAIKRTRSMIDNVGKGIFPKA